MLALLLGLAERVPTLRDGRWTMYRMSMKDAPGGDCVLAVAADGLCLDDQHIAPTAIAVDGECLRIGWDGGEVLLMPTGKQLTARERARKSLALEKRLGQLVGR